MRTMIMALLLLVLAMMPGRVEAAGLPLKATLSPNPVTYSAAALVSVVTRPGAACGGYVVYADGTNAALSKVSDAGGKVALGWFVLSRAAGGVAVITCGNTAQEVKTLVLPFKIGKPTRAPFVPGTSTPVSVPPTTTPVPVATSTPVPSTPTAVPVATQVPQTSTPIPATATIAPAPASVLQVTVDVSPNPIPYGAYPVVTVQTAPGAACGIAVRYDTGREPTSYRDHMATADAAGRITESGQWHMESHGGSGTVAADCSAGAATGSGSVNFGITQ